MLSSGRLQSLARQASEAMVMLVRHLLSIGALPFVMAVVIPTWIARRDHITPRIGETLPLILIQIGGVAALAVGVILFVSSLRRFATEGKGTLAPWDPPRELVVHGPYRYVRNPMISGVIFILLAEAMILLSKGHLWWALIFFAINAVYIPLLEEPQLEARFGESYREYRRHVPRMLPRLKPWQPQA